MSLRNSYIAAPMIGRNIFQNFEENNHSLWIGEAEVLPTGLMRGEELLMCVREVGDKLTDTVNELPRKNLRVMTLTIKT